MPTPLGAADNPKVRVNSGDRLTRSRDREDKVCPIRGHQRRRHLISIINAVVQADTSRSDISNGQDQAPGELALNIKVPLRLVTSAGIKLNMRGSERAQIEQLEGLVRKASDGRIGQHARQIEWIGPRHPVSI